jgi:type IV pilus assembly protein PilP
MKYNYLAMMIAVLGLIGCGEDNSVASLERQITAEEAKAKKLVPPLERDVPTNPQKYDDADLNKVDPFSEQKLLAKLPKEQTVDSVCKRELEKDKQTMASGPLQSVALDAIKFVGIVRDPVANMSPGKNSRAGRATKNRLYAMVSIEGKILTVDEGQILGQNYGKIISISETEITLNERVESGAGDCVERKASLPLEETAK